MAFAPASSSTDGSARRRGLGLLLAAATVLPVSLIWDFSWESTVGIDLFFAPPHLLTFFAFILAGAGVVVSTTKRANSGAADAIRLGRLEAPFGAWLVSWGILAFVSAVWFDRWWQSAYGLSAGIWHPPQLLKAAAFFALLFGVWLFALAGPPRSGVNALAGGAAGGLILVLIHIVTLTSSYPNHQHSATFYKVACATYPVVLVALAWSGSRPWSATTGAAVYTLLVGVMVWLLPCFPAKPEVGPIYQPLDHLMPPPFPLLLLVPALVLDLAMKKVTWPAWPAADWWRAAGLGLVFFLCFVFAQWFFAEFLLRPAADNWFFAGGGRHWPFFLKISPAAKVAFWESAADQMNGVNTLLALAFSVAAARVGLWLGAWFARVRR